MAAGTASASEVLLDVERAWIGPAMRELIEYDIPRALVIPFVQPFTIPSTSVDDANDFLRLIQVPAGAYIWQWRSTPSDMDSGSTLAYDILVAEESGPGTGVWTTKVSLVTGSTNGRAAAGSDSLLAASAGKFIGFSANTWIVFKTTTAATGAVAGTLKCAWQLSLGAINRTKRGVLLTDAGV